MSKSLQSLGQSASSSQENESTWRPCGDYHCLNMITKLDYYPLPNMADITFNLHGTRIFSKLDLLKRYYQVSVFPNDIPRSTITFS